jgi:histidinol dehydrogenase
MKITRGFNKARSLLDRTLPLYSKHSTSSEGKPGTKGLSDEQKVSEIIAEVQAKGDTALFYYTKKFDKTELDSLEVTVEDISKAYQKVDKKLLSALQMAAKRIREFHAICRQKIDTTFLSDGVGRRFRPLDRVGIYVPGGTAAYPSTVLMTAIPARVAGVKEIIMVTPPGKDGAIPSQTLVAADIAGVNRIFKIGGAQAIAALAYGTQSVPKVDKICGPGNIYVALAKKLVFGAVDIDGIQGPSEIIVVADDNAEVSFCAADLIAQAEHDSMASAILITTSAKLAIGINDEIEAQLKKLERRKIICEAFKSRGMIVLVDNLDEAIELVNLYAPEHLLLMVRNAPKYLKKINNAGCIFVSKTSPVVLGDYVAGPSHVLPTGGTARFSSPLSIDDFLKAINIVYLSEGQEIVLGKAAIVIAEAEGLQAHANAVKIRLQAAKSKR